VASVTSGVFNPEEKLGEAQQSFKSAAEAAKWIQEQKKKQNGGTLPTAGGLGAASTKMMKQVEREKDREREQKRREWEKKDRAEREEKRRAAEAKQKRMNDEANGNVTVTFSSTTSTAPDQSSSSTSTYSSSCASSLSSSISSSSATSSDLVAPITTISSMASAASVSSGVTTSSSSTSTSSGIAGPSSSATITSSIPAKVAAKVGSNGPTKAAPKVKPSLPTRGRPSLPGGAKPPVPAKVVAPVPVPAPVVVAAVTKAPTPPLTPQPTSTQSTSSTTTDTTTNVIIPVVSGVVTPPITRPASPIARVASTDPSPADMPNLSLVTSDGTSPSSQTVPSLDASSPVATVTVLPSITEVTIDHTIGGAPILDPGLTINVGAGNGREASREPSRGPSRTATPVTSPPRTPNVGVTPPLLPPVDNNVVVVVAGGATTPVVTSPNLAPALPPPDAEVPPALPPADVTSLQLAPVLPPVEVPSLPLLDNDRVPDLPSDENTPATTTGAPSTTTSVTDVIPEEPDSPEDVDDGTAAVTFGGDDDDATDIINDNSSVTDDTASIAATDDDTKSERGDDHDADTALTCTDCHTVLDIKKFYLQKGDPYCESCYLRIFCSCAGCKLPMKMNEQFVSFGGKASSNDDEDDEIASASDTDDEHRRDEQTFMFHTHCFNCFECGSPFRSRDVSHAPIGHNTHQGPAASPVNTERRRSSARRRTGLLSDPPTDLSLAPSPLSPMSPHGSTSSTGSTGSATAAGAVTTVAGKAYEGVFKKGSRVYCRADWSRLYANRCPHCLEYIMGDQVDALGHRWHPDHFQCAGHACGKSLVNIPFFALSEEQRKQIAVIRGEHNHDVSFADNEVQVKVELSIVKAALAAADDSKDDTKSIINSDGTTRRVGWADGVVDKDSPSTTVTTGGAMVVKIDLLLDNIQKAYCDDCYTKLFVARCTACKQEMRSNFLVVKGKPFHTSCFVCCECPTSSSLSPSLPAKVAPTSLQAIKEEEPGDEKRVALLNQERQMKLKTKAEVINQFAAVNNDDKRLTESKGDILAFAQQMIQQKGSVAAGAGAATPTNASASSGDTKGGLLIGPDTKVYCHSHYGPRFSKRCATCNDPVVTGAVPIGKLVYHSQCLKCVTCMVTLVQNDKEVIPFFLPLSKLCCRYVILIW
jgi:hypothetical protein